ncbi:hypothetical protein [Flavobacterium notoginsengisoli]|uniref:hypothetical protein n=1 Tax=Flavobacterium notoginsengisoli TaxID=1478199 RepID=UPI00362764AF
MKRKLLLIIVLLIGGLFVSCSGDDSGDKTQNPVLPEIKEPLPITITELSSDFIINGQNLELKGTNFINKDYPTIILFNDTEQVTAKEVTDTKIVIPITDAIKAGINSVKVQINKTLSSRSNFFVMKKGWNKLNGLGNIDIHTSNVFDDSNSIFSFADSDTRDFAFWGFPAKLQATSEGLTKTNVKQNGGSYGAFKMVNDKIGVLTNTNEAFYSNNGFETNNSTTVNSSFSPNINGLNIGYADQNMSIVTTFRGGQIYTADNGATIIKNEVLKWTARGSFYRAYITSFAKSASNGKFYQLGVINDFMKEGSNKHRNIVLESTTGYSNWTVIDTISKANLDLTHSYKFLNINKVLVIDVTNKALVASTDMLKTWNTIKTDVSSVFLRTETQWYIQSGDKIFVTKDSGVSWELELELPAGSVVNDISFSKSKIIVSGNKGLHYLKLE